jgi:hypothetical protein
MSSGTITSTTNTFGDIPGTLTGSVGVPGPQGPAGSTGATGATGPAGPAGSPGQGVPAGGTAGQYLQKIDGTNYNTDWVTLNLSAYLTTSAAASTYYPLTNPSGYITSSSLSPYLLSSTAASTYQTLAGMSDYLAKAGNLAGLANTSTARTNLGLGSLAVVNDAPSDGSQYARKNAAWDVVISGDRYLTTSTTSNTISNGNKTFTIGTGLSYTPTQNITISYNASNHMHGEVLTYNSGTGVLTVDVNHHTGSGTYAAWVVNVGGVTPQTSVAWGGITGVLGPQADLAKADNLSGLASTSTARTNLGLGSLAVVNDAPSDGSQYARKNAAWEVVSGGGGGLITSVTSPLAVTSGDLSVDLSAYAALSGASFTGPIDFSDGTQSISIDLAASQIMLASAVGSAGSLFINLDGAVLSWNGLNFSSMNYSRDAIYFPDSTTQTTAGIPAAPNDGNYYVHKNGAWFQCGVTQVQGTDLNNYNVLTVP